MPIQVPMGLNRPGWITAVPRKTEAKTGSRYESEVVAL